MNYANARYKAASKGGARSARSSLNYGLHRAGDDGERVQRGEREIVTHDGAVSKDEALERLDAFEARATAAGRETYYYSLVVNPGQGRNDVDKGEYIREVMGRFEGLHADRGARMEWAGVAHTDQGKHDHVHITLATDKTLNKAELNELREKIAPEAWRVGVRSRDAEREVVTDRAWERMQERVQEREGLGR